MKTAILKSSVVGVMLTAGAFFCEAGPWEVRAVQLDLARQMETVPFVKGYLRFAKESGFNTVVLYLEGRVKTKSFPFRKDEESYTPDEMREVVAEAERLGIDLVPVVSVLGHAENFFGYPEMDGLSEEREGPGRFPWAKNKCTFCHSLPGTREFLEKYLAEMFEIFPGKNFHVGLDESFNTGFCPLCRPKMEKDGLGALYGDVIAWAHGFLAKHGRRMWMWDDFFEYFPERIYDIPRNVVRCNWEYSNDVSLNRGPYGHFAERFRKNWLGWYERLGADGLVCPWRDPVNIDLMTRYGDSVNVHGGLVTQWEMSCNFHGIVMPTIRATGKWWSRGVRTTSLSEMMDESIAELFPELNATERGAVKVLLDTARRVYPPVDDLKWYRNGFPRGEKTDAERLAVSILKASALHPGEGEVNPDPFSSAAMLDDLVAQAELNLHWDFFSSVAPRMLGVKRDPAEMKRLKDRIRGVRPDIERLQKRRVAQENAWRPKCRPNWMKLPPNALRSTADRFLALPEETAKDDEWQIELNFMLPDYHGIVTWNIYALVDGKRERIVKDGGWKPEEGERSYFERTIPVKLAKKPTALRIVYTGYSEAGLAYVALANRSGRLVPDGVTRTEGLVRDPAQVLEDTVAAAYFGDPRGREQMLQPKRGAPRCVMELSLKEEFGE